MSNGEGNTGNGQIEKLYTVEQVARYLSFHKNTVYRWIEAGKLQVIRVGSGKIRIPHSELLRIVGEKKANLEQ